MIESFFLSILAPRGVPPAAFAGIRGWRELAGQYGQSENIVEMIFAGEKCCGSVALMRFDNAGQGHVPGE